MAVAAFACVAANAVEVEDFYKDYGAAAFGYYNMGYAPEYVAGQGWNFTAPPAYDEIEITDENREDEKYVGCEIITKTVGEGEEAVAKEYFKVPNGNVAWYQFFAADGVPTIADETCTITVMIKADRETNFNVNFGNWDKANSGSLKVTTEWTAQTLELVAPVNSCFVVFQPGAQDTNFEMKWLTVSHEDASLDADFLCMKATNLSTKEYSYDQTIDFNFPSLGTGNFTISFDVWVDVDDTINLLPNGSWAWDNRGFAEAKAGEWRHFTKDVTYPLGDDTELNKLAFFIGTYKGTEVYFDNFCITKKGETENLIADLNGNFAKAANRGWSKPGWHSFSLGVGEGPGHFTAVPTLEGWSTFCCDKPLKFKDNVDVYQAVGVNGSNYITLEKIEGVVPANTGILVDGQAAATLDILETVEEGEALADNLLKAAFGGDVVAASDASATRYVFGTQNDVTGFFRVANDMTVPAGKNVAYLELPVAASKAPRCIVIDGGNVTAISDVAVDAENADNAIYNLQGVRVDKPVKGLYIVNGKKVVY